MRKNKILLLGPKRQSWVAIILILWKTYKVIFRQLVPLALIFLIGGKGPQMDKFFWGAIAVTFISMTASILRYFRFTYSVFNDELVVEQGIFQRSKLSIHVDRIQSVNYEQNIIHKIFEVVKLKVDTAGSDKDEMAIDALDKETAEEIKAILTPSLHLEKNSAERRSEDKEIVVIAHSPIETLKAGLFENHLNSAAVVFAFAIGLYIQLKDIGVDVEDYTSGYDIRQVIIAQLIIFLILAIIVFVAISIIRTYLKYYNLKVTREKFGFKLSSGLLTTKTTIARDHKVQTLKWGYNFIKKWIGHFDIELKQAGSSDKSARKSIVIPYCTASQVSYVKEYLYPSLQYDESQFSMISVFWVKRMFMIIGFGTLLLLVGALYFGKMQWMVGIIIAGAFLVFRNWFRYIKAGYLITEDYLVIKGGIFGSVCTILPLSKVQSIDIVQSPSQRRRDLCTIAFHHAAGHDSIFYIPLQEGRMIKDFILFTIESKSKKSLSQVI